MKHSTGFQPFAEIGDTDRLQFHLRSKWPQLSTASNIALHPSIPASYYFCNDSAVAANDYPDLTLPIPEYSATHAYEMGSLVRESDDLYQAQRRVSGAGAFASGPNEDWMSWLNDEGIPSAVASDADSRLLPRKFTIQFRPRNGMATAEGAVSLKALDDTDISSLSFAEAQNVSSIAVDFSDVPEGNYKLEISTTGGYQEERSILLSDTHYDKYVFGFLDLAIKEASNEFRVLENNGAFRLDDDDKLSPPNYRILLPNRYTYWRYKVQNQEAALNLSNAADVKLVSDIPSMELETKLPQPLCSAITRIQVRADAVPDDDINDTILLPNPDYSSLAEDLDGRYISTVFINKITT